jgi:hypothetical protein
MRLVTRADFDGLACSVLLDHLGILDFWEFVHPTEVQNNCVKITGNDIIANLPFVKGCKIWFDHHSSETERLGAEFFEEREAVMQPHIKSAFVPALGVSEQTAGEEVDYETVKVSYAAPSCAHIVYDYYSKHGFNLVQFKEMVRNVDKVDSGDLTPEEIDNPSGWILFGLIMDPRTQLEKVRKYRTGIKELTGILSGQMQKLSLDEVLLLPDVRERIDAYFAEQPRFRETAAQYTRIEGPVIIMDLRGIKTIPAGNRFVLYSMYPAQNISITVMDGSKGGAAIAVGHSIVNKTSSVDVGSLLLKYSGGGHARVGSCTVPHKDVERVIAEIIAACKT